MQPAADSRCARCRTPHHSQYCPLDPDRFASGDIWGISEATRVPIQLILYRNRPAAARNSREAGLSSKWSVAPKNTGSGKYWEYNARPCIMMSAGDPYSSNGHPICLLATFHGAAVLQDLPEVLRRFCVPISPHPLSAQDGVHLHITPEWLKADAWVIAWLYVTYSPLQGRWQNKAPGSSWNSSYKLDDEAFAKLLDLCRERRKQWEELCTQDKELRKRCVVEYKAMNARIKREAGLVKTRKEKDEPVKLSPTSIYLPKDTNTMPTHLVIGGFRLGYQWKEKQKG
ncbi:hypothetical protein C2E23DRAFT_574548 [Lenzites betulinus]|nr:hypothetical protein C2E23DRAFT_574548 [Lenzites betulinus]